MYENKKSLLVLLMPNIFSYVEVAETVCGCLQEARAEVRNSMQSRDYLYVCKNHVQQRKGCETVGSLRRTNSLAALHKAAEEAGNGFGTWPVFSAFLPGFGCIHSSSEEAQAISSFVLSDGA